MVLSTVGAAYGTAKAGIGIAGLGQVRPDLMMKSLIPVVVSGELVSSFLLLLVRGKGRVG
jgi:V-type H+-transporting ATPase proteolipid subunit